MNVEGEWEAGKVAKHLAFTYTSLKNDAYPQSKACDSRLNYQLSIIDAM
jgi:hypothetical protein